MSQLRTTPTHYRKILGVAFRLGIVAVCLGFFAPAPYALVQQQPFTAAAQALQQQNYADALIAYQALLPSRPNDPVLWQRLVRLARQVHRPDLALTYIQQAATHIGWSPALYRLVAETLAEQGDAQRALPYWQVALTGSSTDDIPILKVLAQDALAQQDWNTAQNRYQQILTLDPDDPLAHYQLGTLLAAIDPTSARDHLEKAARDIRYVPTLSAINDVYNKYGGGSSAQIAFQVGLTLSGAQIWPQAEHALALAQANGLDNATTLAFLALAQDYQHRDGWPLLNRASLLAPDDPIINYALAVHWRLTGDHDKALEALNRAGALDPTDAAVTAEIGLTYRQQRQLTQAAQWLNRAVSLAPKDNRLQETLATFYADESYDLAGEGLTTLEKLAKNSPRNATILASLAAAYLANNQLDAAKQRLQQALEIDETNIRARYFFGQYLEAARNPDAALPNYLYVYENGGDSLYREQALRALHGMGYQPALRDMIGNAIP